jgi:serine protease Do
MTTRRRITPDRGWRALALIPFTQIVLALCTAQEFPPTQPPGPQVADVNPEGLRTAYRSPAPSLQENALLASDDPDSVLGEELVSLERLSSLYRKVARRLRSTVVHIEAQKRSGEGQEGSYAEAGAGVAIDIAGQQCILTNRHVIADATLQGITIVTEQRRRFHPIRVLEDPVTDIAVLIPPADATTLASARIGDDSHLEIGDFVLAFGSPFGLSHSLTHGIVSAKGRHDLDLGLTAVRVQDFIQTDAAINPGNSGGPLMNLRGEIVGINTAIASNSGGNDGIGFAIPINLAVRVANELVLKGKIVRPFLGVKFEANGSPSAAVVEDFADQGARVRAVSPDSPATQAGVLPGDVITVFNGIEIESHTHLASLVALTPVGESIRITVYRQGKLEELLVHLQARLP